MQYWYSAQLRQYRIQFIRVFSNFYVQTGLGGPNNTAQLIRVPCRYGDSSRIAETVVRGNSENKLLSTPFITCYLTSIQMSATRRLDPTLVETVIVNEREYDESNQQYLNTIGNRYAVERYMPVPYDLTMQVDIWTSNLDQKEQLFEQIMVLFNPSIDIQTSNNPIDWSWLTYCEMQDTIIWSSRSIPMGTENPIDVMTLQFKIPALINPPAKIKKQAIIQEIVANLRLDATHNDDDVEWVPNDFILQDITSPGDYAISLIYVDANRYYLSLTNHAGDSHDTAQSPTITYSQQNPQLLIGSNFVWNDITIAINTNVLSDFVTSTNAMLSSNPNMSLMLMNDTVIQFINTAGTDNVFESGLPDSLSKLGIAAGIHPGGNFSWRRLIESYGKLKPYSRYQTSASSISVLFGADVENITHSVNGYLDWHPLNQNLLIWSIIPSTLPATTINTITSIVNPQIKGPSAGLAAAALGQRYLLVEKPADESASWLITGSDTVTVSINNPTLILNSEFTWNTHIITIGSTNPSTFAFDTTAALKSTGLYVVWQENTLKFINNRGTANNFISGAVSDGLTGIGIESGIYRNTFDCPQSNDIIEWSGTTWRVLWSAAAHQNTIAYVINQLTGKMLEWDGTQWSEYLPKHASPGYWHIKL